MSLRPRLPAEVAPSEAVPALSFAVESVVLHGLPLDRAGAERVRVALVAELTARLSALGLSAFERAIREPLTVRLRETDSPEDIALALARTLTEPESLRGGKPCRS